MHVRNHELLDVKIRQYLLPAIMMKLALQLGAVVDTIFVGNLLGTHAMEAIGLCAPVLALIQIPGYYLGNGGAITASILLGRRKKREARKIFTTTFVITAICAVLFVLTAIFLSGPIAHLLSRGGTLEADVQAYIFYLLAGSPGFCIGLLMSCYLAADSHPQLAGAYFVISNAVNLILDYIFLKFTPLGVRGAALSTMLGFVAGLVVLIPYVRSKKRMLGFSLAAKAAEPAEEPPQALQAEDSRDMRAALKTGLPYLMFLAVNMVKSLLLNGIIISFFGNDGMAVYTVCANAEFVLVMLIGGLMGVIPNIAGTLYGEKDFYGLHVLCGKMLRYGAILTGVLMLIVLIFTKQFTLLFGVKDPQLQEAVMLVLRIFVFSLPFNFLNYFGSQYYGAVEKPTIATIITTLENGVILVPAVLLGVFVNQAGGGSGYLGFGLAFVASEGLTALAAFLYRKLKYRGEPFLLIPAENPGNCLDFSIPAAMEDVAKVPREILDFCGRHAAPREMSNRIAVCAEEMAHNVVQYGGKTSQWIDICLTVLPKTDTETGEEENFILRIRDNGIHFDPTSYERDGDEFDIHGIELVKKLAKKVTYVRAMDLNNTTITV